MEVIITGMFFSVDELTTIQDCKFPHLNEWYNYLKENESTVPKDVWISFRDFIIYDEDFTGFDMNSAFPSIFDEFGKYKILLFKTTNL